MVWKRVLPLLLAAGILLAGCSAAPFTAPAGAVNSQNPTQPATEVAHAVPVATQTSLAMAEWSADGSISPDEYAHQTVIDGVSLSWRTDSTYLYLAASARTTAWVAVGFEPEDGMQGANLILGAILDGRLVIDDQYGVDRSSHESDATLGGSDDIAASAGTLADGVTTWEAQIPLDSGDQYDKPLAAGQLVQVIVATGTSTSFGSPHSSRASGQIQLD